MGFSESVARRGIDSPWEGLLTSLSLSSGVPLPLIQGVIAAESGWTPDAINRTGTVPSYGLMQITESWAPRETLLNPEENLRLGVWILSDQLARRPTWELALAGYNAGTSRSNSDLQNRLDNNTLGVRSYVQTVLAYASWYTPMEGITVSPGETDVELTLTAPGPNASWLLVPILFGAGLALIGRRTHG